MASSEGRRSFLLGITLNELSFIMFFLLMITSVAVLQKNKDKLTQEIEQKNKLEVELAQSQQDAESFKRLQLLENKLIQAAGLTEKPHDQQLDELFSRLQEVKVFVELQQANTRMQQELESLQAYKRLAETLEQHGIAEQPAQEMIEQLLEQADTGRRERELLKGRVAYMQKKLKGNGLDHPPCWANPESGAVEYLYSMTLFENSIKIEAAWPEHRETDVLLISGAKQLAGKSLTPEQLQQQVKPIFTWSKQHECRHFVRIKDDPHTSKNAFKQKMRAVEAYFYKYLQR